MVRRSIPYRVERETAVLGDLDFVPFEYQSATDESGDRRLIFHHQQPGGHIRSPLSIGLRS